MKFKTFFDNGSSLYPFRWFIVVAATLVMGLAYSDYTGWRIFSFSNQQAWSSSGPSGHK